MGIIGTPSQVGNSLRLLKLISHLKSLRATVHAYILLVITIVSSRMIAPASLSKHLQKIKIAKDLCGTESLNSGRFMFKGSNHHVTLSFVYGVNLTREFVNLFQKQTSYKSTEKIFLYVFLW